MSAFDDTVVTSALVDTPTAGTAAAVAAPPQPPMSIPLTPKFAAIAASKRRARSVHRQRRWSHKTDRVLSHFHLHHAPRSALRHRQRGDHIHRQVSWRHARRRERNLVRRTILQTSVIRVGRGAVHRVICPKRIALLQLNSRPFPVQRRRQGIGAACRGSRYQPLPDG